MSSTGDFQASSGSQTRIWSDRPIRTAKDDEYGFARTIVPRLFRVAVEWPGSAGLIVGLHGAWGTGKTSVLNLLQQYTHERAANSVHLARFNAWLYDDQRALIVSFFHTLAETLRQAGGSLGKAAGKAKAMGKFLGAAASGVEVGGFGFDLGRVVETRRALSGGEQAFKKSRDGLGKELSDLGERGGRLLVMVDDVDRLSRAELMNLFRLLRQVGDLPALTIIVAMDDIRVNRLLNVSGDESFGKEFMEKIIQASISIPVFGQDLIEPRLANGIQDVLLDAGYETPDELREQEWAILTPKPLKAISALVESPRDLNRILNALRLLLLAGDEDPDVHPSDAVLVTTLSLFFPDAHRAIQANRARLVDYNDHLYSLGHDHQTARDRRHQTLRTVAAGGERGDPDSHALEIITLLFPDSHPSPGEVSRLAAERRIASTDFFGNYFRLAPAPDRLTRGQLNDLVEAIQSARGQSELDFLARRVSALKPIEGDQLASRLHGLLTELPPAESIDLGRQILSAIGPAENEVMLAIFWAALHGAVVAVNKSDAKLDRSEARLGEFLREATQDAHLVVAAYTVRRLLRGELDGDTLRSISSTWLARFAATPREEIFALEFYDFLEVLLAVRSADGRLAGVDSPSDLRRKWLCDSVREAPERLPKVLRVASVSSGEEVYLQGQIRSVSDAVAAIDEVIGTDCLRDLLAKRDFWGVVDEFGLIEEAGRLIVESDELMDRSSAEDN